MDRSLRCGPDRVPSSRGLGHHPLKVETRVRTPLGLRRIPSSEAISFPLPASCRPADYQIPTKGSGECEGREHMHSSARGPHIR